MTRPLRYVFRQSAMQLVSSTETVSQVPTPTQRCNDSRNALIQNHPYDQATTQGLLEHHFEMTARSTPHEWFLPQTHRYRP